MSRSLFTLLLLTPLLSAEPVRIQAENSGLSADRLKRISQGMQHYIDRGEVSGVVTLVARRGQLAYLDAQGFLDKDAQTPIRTDSIFRIASMTKPITTVAV